MQSDDVDDLLKMREDALEYRKKAEEEMLKKMLGRKQITPNSYDMKVKKLGKWVQKEKFDINK